MNKSIRAVVFLCALCILTVAMSCKENTSKNQNELAFSQPKEELAQPKKQLSKEFKDYWYAGKAEITSYKLEQARYGEIREGKAVMVFVTEDFLTEKQVKADNYSPDNIPVLKLNTTKNFNTGIYPYSIMQSTFFPVSNNQHLLKASASIQEWCGHVYAQLNNRDDFEVMAHSYFQNEADQNFNIAKTWTENELWSKLRIDPKSLPTGTFKIVPSLEFTRLKHKPIKAYTANAKLKNGNYTLNYPELNRSLNIEFNSDFPYEIYSWQETSKPGSGSSDEIVTTKATRLESIKSAYWSKNSNADEQLRGVLKLQ
ncbi:septum formation inhibitor Maf [uncultured Winogradskyella sp.]|uniref:septum formation inhibitor Maf n=1 Tax=uncultured Winogradskyella sp. TaxID=395353 RepID=UPI00262BD134|nr:septum formation inhibitor Maf [uncultured Winogradskyella sp.]